MSRYSRLLTARRIRGHATVIALCLWTVFAFDFATPGSLDRAGNIKFQDFLPFYISARMITQHRASDLYDRNKAAEDLRSIVHEPTRVSLPNLYGPQVGLLFVPLTGLSFSAAARIWVMVSLLIYFACIYAVWRHSPNLRQYTGTIVFAAIAYPPFFHLFVRGQIAALVLACFTAAFLALRNNLPITAGLALGLLAFKPQFLVAIPLVLLLAHSWRILAGLILSAAAQLTFARACFGASVMHSYLDTVLHPARWIQTAELPLAALQMHSLRSFWTLLIPNPTAALVLYVVSAIAAIAVAASIWKSSSPLAIRFSALLLAAVLANPHLFIYDLLVLAPVFLLLSNAIESNAPNSPVSPLLYLAYVLPIFVPIAQWTHLQLSVPVFAALLWTLCRPQLSDTRAPFVNLPAQRGE